MAEKKNVLGTALLIGVAAAAVAGGVVSYLKRAEIKRLAEDIITRVRPVDGKDEEIGDWDICCDAAETDAADVNIVDSGLSLESVEAPEDGSAEEAENEPESESADEDAPESSGDAGQPEPESEPDAAEDGPESEQSVKKENLVLE